MAKMTRYIIANPNVAIRTISKKGYDFCTNVHSQRKEWKSQRGAEKAFDNLKTINKTGAECLRIQRVMVESVDIK